MIKANKNTISLVSIRNTISENLKTLKVAQKTFREKKIVKKMKFSNQKVQMQKTLTHNLKTYTIMKEKNPSFGLEEDFFFQF